jgi:phage terminase large subunit-like protein
MVVGEESQRLLKLKREELRLTREKRKFELELPHLYRRHYKWSRDYYESSNKINLICAANQIGKSSVAIRRVIGNATEPERWKKLWGLNKAPSMLWYFYPDQETKMREFETKWKEWLPNGSMQISEKYGWEVMPKINAGKLPGIKFNSGANLYFMTYSQDATAMQASTVYDITADEELPLHLYDELIMRLTRTKGYFNAVFTPTLNQQFWREVFETERRLPMAFKQQVSMYDCLRYDDGIQSEFFTEDTIKEIESKCKSQIEIDRRVHGKFVTEEGRKFYGFDRARNYVSPVDIKGFHRYASVDPGSGGKTGHPAAIVFVALSADCKSGYVYITWRGDGIETTAQDILAKYVQLKSKDPIAVATYDFSAKDFGIIAARSGYAFNPANKSRELGEDLLNTLLKTGMLKIFDNGVDDDNHKLVLELEHALLGEKKQGANKKGDDLRDALRYCVMSMPWDLSCLTFAAEDEVEKIKQLEQRDPTPEELEKIAVARQIEERRGMFHDARQTSEKSWADEYNDDIAELNDLYG